MSEELIGGYSHPEISHEEALRLQQKLADWDWEKFRRETAKDILCAILSTRDSADEEHIQMAVEIADSLIAKLKEDADGQRP